MNKIKNSRALKKLRSGSGMSIGELLVATLIVLLVTSGVASGMQLALTQYNRSMIQSESKVLYSTLENVITNELSNTDDIRLGKEKIDYNKDGTPEECYKLDSFFSRNFASTEQSRFYSTILYSSGNMSESYVDKDGAVNDSVPGYGLLAVGTKKADGQVVGKLILNSAAYSTYGLGAKVDVIYDKTRRVFHVNLCVSDKNGYVLGENEYFDVYQLNSPDVSWTETPGVAAISTVTYEYGNGPLSGSLSDSAKVHEVTDVSSDVRYSLPTAAPYDWGWNSPGVHLGGWKLSAGSEKYKPGSKITVYTDITLTAVWVCDVIYQDAKGFIKDEIVSVEYNTDHTIKAPTYPYNGPNKDNSDGFYFVKWGELTPGETTKVTSAMTLNAVWEREYPVEFYNGTSLFARGNLIEKDDTHYTLQAISMPDSAPVHSGGSDAWSFNGWYSSDKSSLVWNGSGEAVNNVKTVELESKPPVNDGKVYLYAGYTNKIPLEAKDSIISFNE